MALPEYLARVGLAFGSASQVAATDDRDVGTQSSADEPPGQ